MLLDPRRVQAIFWEAVQYPDPADRAVVLERECTDDAALRHRVARLLEAHDEYDGFVNEPADIPRVGPWGRRLGSEDGSADAMATRRAAEAIGYTTTVCSVPKITPYPQN
jgi:hypothetical protein